MAVSLYKRLRRGNAVCLFTPLGGLTHPAPITAQAPGIVFSIPCGSRDAGVGAGEKSMEVSASYGGGVRFEIAARNHRVICDQPPENGGADAGMSPPEFLLASLATCAGYYAAQY